MTDCIHVVCVQDFLIQNVHSLQEYKGHANNFIFYLIPRIPYSHAQYTLDDLLDFTSIEI